MKSRIVSIIGLVAIVGSWANGLHAQNNPDQLFEFIQSVYNRHDKKLSAYLIEEMSQYAALFPEGSKVAEVQFLMAAVYEEKGDEHQALAGFLKTIFLYPDSTRRQDAAEEARRLIAGSRSLKKHSAKLLAAIDGQMAGGTMAERYHAYLDFLMNWNESKLRNWTLAEANRFVTRFPEDRLTPEVMGWVADLYARGGDERQAEASYLKLEYLYAEGEILPYARYQRGLLQYEELGSPDLAVKAFSKVVTLHPQSEYAAAALFKMGEAKWKKMKDYEGAIADFRSLVDVYPQQSEAVDGLMAIAEINASKQRDYEAAVAAYNEVVSKFREDKRGITALEKAGDLYRKKLKDYSRAAATFARVADVYPSYENAPTMLLKAGTVLEDKEKDYVRAIEYYQQVVDKYPDHKEAENAVKRIEKARKKMEKR